MSDLRFFEHMNLVSSGLARGSLVASRYGTMLVVAAMLALGACGGDDGDPGPDDGGGDGSTVVDAGHDSGSNGGTDAGHDSGSNGGTDAGQDSGSNGGDDAGPTDAGYDANTTDACPPGSSTATPAQVCSEYCGALGTLCSLPMPDGGDCMAMCEVAYSDTYTTAFQRGRIVDCFATITNMSQCSSGLVCADMARFCP